MTEPKILFFDIETALMKVYTFSLFKPVIGINQIIEKPRVICWSAKWAGSKTVLFQSEYHDGYIEMLTGLRDLMDEADIIVGYNSDSFDVKWMNEQFAFNKIEAPAPSQYVDLYKLNKKYMKTPSGKLDYMAWNLLGDRKVSHSGIQLWIDCMDGDDKRKAAAWKLMKKYAIQDTALLEPIYQKVLPWITNVNMGLFSGGDLDLLCTHCGSDDLERRGFSHTTAGKFQRYQCRACAGWSKDPRRVSSTALRPMA